MKTTLTSSTFGALARRIHSAIIAALLPALLLLLSIQPTHAGSATWKTTPTSGDWYTANNWTPATVPNGPTDTATFNTSTITAISFPASSATELDGIIYNSGASAFTTTVAAGGGCILQIEGPGITNNSGIAQTIIVDSGGSEMYFLNSATVQSPTSIVASGGITAGGLGGWIFFSGGAGAGNGTFTINGGAAASSTGGLLYFSDTASADNGTITINGGAASNAYGGSFTFTGGSTAGNATIINNGSSVFDGFTGGQTSFQGDSTSTAGNATLIANAGSNGGPGGSILFQGSSSGGTARVEVFGNGILTDTTNGSLTIRDQVPPVLTIGSLEGSGLVHLGAKKLTVGSNNLTTAFSGLIEDNGGVGGPGSLAKTGRGKFTLSNANTYTGGTTVTKGTLLVTNRTGSATGTGTVAVNAGTLGGTGKISGIVTIGTATTTGILSPGSGARPGKLTLANTLTFNAHGNYKVDLNSTTVTADQVVAKGVTIASGATATIDDLGTAVLASGTVFTVINNTAATPIAGTFSNLPDGSKLVVGSNTYLVSYEGGTGNDLTLTVQ